MSGETAVTDAPQKKGGAPVSARPQSQDVTMLKVAERPSEGKTKGATVAKFHTVSETARAAAWLNEFVGRANSGIVAEVIDVGPALAEVLLERNLGNRNIKLRRVADFVRDMTAGNWKLNGEPIIVTVDGMLNDGQHRCAAIVEAAVKVPMLIIAGVAADTRDTLDHGVVRSPGDDLSLHGYVNTAQLAATARMLWRWRQYGVVRHGGQNAPTRVELMQTVADNPGLPKSLLIVGSLGAKARALGSPSMLAFCHFAFKTTANETDVTYFFDALIEGENLKRGDPILNARNRLITERRILAIDQKVELLFRAWNAHRLGDTTRVAFRLSGGELPLLEA